MYGFPFWITFRFRIAKKLSVFGKSDSDAKVQIISDIPILLHKKNMIKIVNVKRFVVSDD